MPPLPITAPAPPSPVLTGWRLVAAALLVMVSWMACSPAPPTALDTGWDKLNHVGAFATLAFVAWQAGVPRLQGPLRVFGALLLYGGLIEIVQRFVPGRSSEGADLLADAVGIAIGLVVAGAWRRIVRGGREGHGATPAR